MTKSEAEEKAKRYSDIIGKEYQNRGSKKIYKVMDICTEENPNIKNDYWVSVFVKQIHDISNSTIQEEIDSFLGRHTLIQ